MIEYSSLAFGTAAKKMRTAYFKYGATEFDLLGWSSLECRGVYELQKSGQVENVPNKFNTVRLTQKGIESFEFLGTIGLE